MGRTVDQRSGIAGRQMASRLGAIRAGLANGSMVRGQTERDVRGDGKLPTWGTILLPAQVESVTPALGRGQTALGWEVIGAVTIEGKGWRAPVVGVRER
jgi:hypothetical protein